MLAADFKAKLDLSNVFTKGFEVKFQAQSYWKRRIVLVVLTPTRSGAVPG